MVVTDVPDQRALPLQYSSSFFRPESLTPDGTSLQQHPYKTRWLSCKALEISISLALEIFFAILCF
jgi:hypothetical protein